MRRLALLLAAAAFLPLSSVFAQNQQPTPAPTPGRVPQWRCTLPGGSYSVAIRSMVSVSLHEYIVDGVARVTEANIDTTGNALTRFYFIEPITPQTPSGIGQSAINKLQELTQQAAERAVPDEPWRKVVKNFPGSTHAHTIEFRVSSKDDLQKLVESADDALKNSRDTTFTLK